MCAEIENELKEYNLCQKTKAARHAPYGLLKSPAVLDGAWKSIVIDFIVKLPLSKDLLTKVKYNVILVITDRNTKYGIFISYLEGLLATQFAYVFQKAVVADHRLL